MDGQYYLDSRAPFQTADWPSITLSTTSLMMWPSGGSPSAFGAGYWTPGKKMLIVAWGRMTTATTPGNLTVEIRFGTTDAGGTILATSAATALAASKTAITWKLEAEIQSRVDVNGTAKGLLAVGKFEYDGAAGLFTTTSQNPMLIPANTPAAVNVDVTAASAINIQFKRSGSTAETAQVHILDVIALN